LKPKTSEKSARKAPWRDNIEAFAVAVIMAVALKYFVLEAYKIPTGSMQPTLMGNEETGIFDRVLVDKLSFKFRDPKRFEVATFKYPLDRSKNFIKRILGMPGEQLWIAHGDVWARKDEREPWRVLRRPRPVQRETWKALDLSDEGDPATWAGENQTASTWSLGPRTLTAHGDGRARFVGRSGSIMDNYTDGYPPGLIGKIAARGASGQNPVGDLRLSGSVRAQADCKSVGVEFTEGSRRYRVEIPGPAAAADATPTISALDTGPNPDARIARAGRGTPYRLPVDKEVQFGAQNLDDELSLDIDGEVVLAVEIELASDQHSSAWITCAGGSAQFDDLQVYRDIYYTEGRGESKYVIPPGNYFMMGDNTQDSSDSREWSLYVMEADIDGKKQALRGNNRFRENPMQQQSALGPMTWFRDEWGELFVLPTQDCRALPPENSPLVPRELMTGRALLVFWPFSWEHRVARVRWVH
jgi:signal peptidase I